jgi:hypothetical protein
LQVVARGIKRAPLDRERGRREVQRMCREARPPIIDRSGDRASRSGGRQTTSSEAPRRQEHLVVGVLARRRTESALAPSASECDRSTGQRTNHQAKRLATCDADLPARAAARRPSRRPTLPSRTRYGTSYMKLERVRMRHMRESRRDHTDIRYARGRCCSRDRTSFGDLLRGRIDLFTEMLIDRLARMRIRY